MKSTSGIKALFAVGGIYDGVLGVAFLVAPAALFGWSGVTPPNHFGYVQFPAAILVIFALMFFAVAADPARNRNLIPYGILFKVAYSGVVFAYWLGPDLPALWKPFAVCDAIFALLFLRAWVRLRP
jgi:hypothetical protein